MTQYDVNEFTDRAVAAVQHRQSQWLNRTSKMMIILLCGFALVGCIKAPTQTSTTNKGEVAVCARPADVVLSNQDVKLAAAQIGKASIGGLDVTNNMKLVQVLSATDHSGLIVDYLMCEAEQRGELDSRDTNRVDYVRGMLSYLYATHPTAQEFAAWLKANPSPARPTARLAMPDFDTRGGKFYFTVSDVVGSFRLLDDGGAPLQVWIAQYPRNHLQFVPGPGPFTLRHGESITVHVGILCCSIPTTPLSMDVRSDVPTMSHIEFKIGDPAKLTAAYTQMLGGFASALGRRLTAAAGQKPAEFLANTAFESVRQAHPDWNKKTSWSIAGSLLSSSNWPAAAAVAYKSAYGKTPNEDSTGPLSEAVYLAGAKNSVFPGPTAPHLGGFGLDSKSLAAGGSNALVNTHPAAARHIAEKLAKLPQFRPYEESLQGDIFLKNGYAKAAASAFHACYSATSAPTCQVRELAAYGAARKLPGSLSLPAPPAIAIH